ncbi:toxin-antitoxin system HicB family antitoxin, partial [Salmonella enterica subsp. enterica serovar Virginia]|nr:toxin-antitoxin system HicB family antitoxin [Salmonella enterica subsp. enterica serovar Virginia]
MACQQQVQLIYMFKAPSLYRPGSARLVESSKHYMTLCQEQIHIKMSQELHLKLKIEAAKSGVTLQDFVIRVISEHFLEKE